MDVYSYNPYTKGLLKLRLLRLSLYIEKHTTFCFSYPLFGTIMKLTSTNMPYASKVKADKPMKNNFKFQKLV